MLEIDDEFARYASENATNSDSVPPTVPTNVTKLERTLEEFGQQVTPPERIDDKAVYVQTPFGKKRITTEIGRPTPLEPTVATELTSMEGHFAELRDVYQSSFDNPHVDIDTKRVFSNKLRNLAEKIIPKQRNKKR